MVNRVTHRINPQIDCVFKAILGANENHNLLIHFLNGVLRPEHAITRVVIESPYNEREFPTDKLTIVDIKARDENGKLYQIELQLDIYSHLSERMLNTWASLHSKQIKKGEDFDKLTPVISIWLLGSNFFHDSPAHHHHFQVWDIAQWLLLSDHMSIHTLELKKWQSPQGKKLNPEEQWLRFFKDAYRWDELPAEMNTQEMRQAMAVLKRFSAKEHEYHLYLSREIAAREEATKRNLFKRTVAKGVYAEAKAEQATAAAEQFKVEAVQSKVEAE